MASEGGHPGVGPRSWRRASKTRSASVAPPTAGAARGWGPPPTASEGGRRPRLGANLGVAPQDAAVSGGERRRVSIGVDPVHDPVVLLLDEPTSRLDSVSGLHIVKMLRDMAAQHGKTVVLTIHQLGFRILELLDRVVLLADSVVRHHGSLAFLEARLVEYAMEAIDSLKPDVLVTSDIAASGVRITPTRGGSGDDDDAAPVPTSARRVTYTNSPATEVRILAGCGRACGGPTWESCSGSWSDTGCSASCSSCSGATA